MVWEVKMAPKYQFISWPVVSDKSVAANLPPGFRKNTKKNVLGMFESRVKFQRHFFLIMNVPVLQGTNR